MGGLEREVTLFSGKTALRGVLKVPVNADGIVLFAHGSGSSRHSPRNRFVAEALNQRRHATLLFDLLTEEEEERERDTRELRFDIGLLADRLVDATDWASDYPQTRELGIGYFGASTGAAAALVAAGRRTDAIRAVVSRGGRPDLAGAALAKVKAPTLLIVGSADAPVIPFNKEALMMLGCPKRLELVPEATHLFEEPGALEAVARLAVNWFDGYLRERKHRSRLAS